MKQMVSSNWFHAKTSDIIAELGLAVETGMTAEDIALTIHAHPTLGEIPMEAADVVLGKPIRRIQLSDRCRLDNR